MVSKGRGPGRGSTHPIRVEVVVIVKDEINMICDTPEEVEMGDGGWGNTTTMGNLIVIIPVILTIAICIAIGGIYCRYS